MYVKATGGLVPFPLCIPYDSMVVAQVLCGDMPLLWYGGPPPAWWLFEGVMGVPGVTGVTGPGVTGVTGVGVAGTCEGVMGVRGVMGIWDDWLLVKGGYVQEDCVSPSTGW